MTHAYHEQLEGYDSRQIWYDGCDECESRGKRLPHSVNTLDDDNFVRAIARSIAWNHDDEIGHVSDAERGLLEYLWVMHLNMQRLSRLTDPMDPSQ